MEQYKAVWNKIKAEVEDVESKEYIRGTFKG